eukprot:10479004-Lingulodinium_polyedra.AAC.1
MADSMSTERVAVGECHDSLAHEWSCQASERSNQGASQLAAGAAHEVPRMGIATPALLQQLQPWHVGSFV